ncbi:MAG TPA: cysteine desulfurase-like protein, partial [Planctomycetota bacterium]|nr:cysteine desulfurase-like protein [Planctomycetota bacterium]
NHGGDFATSRATDAMLGRAQQALADLLGGAADEVVFGANMTTMTFHLARALARTWRAGDEVVVSDSDHDANVTPWTIAARDAGCTVRAIAVRPDGSLDQDSAQRQLGPRTRLLAVGAASNLTGTVHPVRALTAMAHQHGALVFVDAVHYAPHLRISAAAWGCDFVACSAYKFFGPHIGVLWARRALLAELPVDKVRPAPDHGPDRWQTGTANFEGIAGTLAAVEYLEQIGRSVGGTGDRSAALTAAFTAISAYERELCRRLLAGLQTLPGVRVVGSSEPSAPGERCPTVSFTHARVRPQALAEHLAASGIFSWAGNSYSLPLTTALGLEPQGALRIGILHYHTAAEVDRLLAELRALLA